MTAIALRFTGCSPQLCSFVLWYSCCCVPIGHTRISRCLSQACCARKGDRYSAHCTGVAVCIQPVLSSPSCQFVVNSCVYGVVHTSNMTSLGGLSVQVNTEGWGYDHKPMLCCYFCLRRASMRFQDVCRPTGVPPGLENVPFAPFSKNDQLGKASDWTNSNFPRVQAGAHAP